jgi:hypothetical protein
MREIPKEVQNLINHYFKLRINGKFVKVPYHINVKHVRGELRSLVGKGSPEEIEDEVNIFAKLRKFNIAQATPEEIREFMQKEGIGIDCSGLVTHILNTWTKSENKGSISSNLTFPKLSLRRRIRVWIRPIENINAELLTNQDNTVKIGLREVQAGDLIRLKGLKKGDHIAIITEVKRDENGIKEIVYVHSSRYYGKDNGIRQGRIRIKNENEDLEKQDWLEKDENGVCWTLKEFLKEKEDNGFRRPKFFMNKK